MHLTVTLPSGTRDLEIARRAARQNLWLWPLSPSYMRAAPRQGFILGFGSTAVAEIAPAVRKIGKMLATK
jgi:DNA-binding transcriptional MocR family regulator